MVDKFYFFFFKSINFYYFIIIMNNNYNSYEEPPRVEKNKRVFILKTHGAIVNYNEYKRSRMEGEKDFMLRTDILKTFTDIELVSTNYIGKYGSSILNFIPYYFLKQANLEDFYNQLMSLDTQKEANNLNKMYMYMLRFQFPEIYKNLIDAYGYQPNTDITNFRIYHSLLEKNPHNINYSFFPYNRKPDKEKKDKGLAQFINMTNHGKEKAQLELSKYTKKKENYNIEDILKYQKLDNFEISGLFEVTKEVSTTFNNNNFEYEDIDNYIIDNILVIKECFLEEIRSYEKEKNNIGIIKCTLLIPSKYTLNILSHNDIDIEKYLECLYYNIIIFIKLSLQPFDKQNLNIKTIIELIGYETFMEEKKVVLLENACKVFLGTKIKKFDIMSKNGRFSKAYLLDDFDDDFLTENAIRADREATLMENNQVESNDIEKIKKMVIQDKLDSLGYNSIEEIKSSLERTQRVQNRFSKSTIVKDKLQIQIDKLTHMTTEVEVLMQDLEDNQKLKIILLQKVEELNVKIRKDCFITEDLDVLETLIHRKNSMKISFLDRVRQGKFFPFDSQIIMLFRRKLLIDKYLFELVKLHKYIFKFF